jgi:hypothetical protein
MLNQILLGMLNINTLFSKNCTIFFNNMNYFSTDYSRNLASQYPTFPIPFSINFLLLLLLSDLTTIHSWLICLLVHHPLKLISDSYFTFWYESFINVINYSLVSISGPKQSAAVPINPFFIRNIVFHLKHNIYHLYYRTLNYRIIIIP